MNKPVDSREGMILQLSSVGVGRGVTTPHRKNKSVTKLTFAYKDLS
jgi:hypothetical protein